MTASEISARIITRIDDDPVTPVSVTAAEVLDAINEGQELAALLTLCFEKTVDFNLSGSTAWYAPRPLFPDFLVPLHLSLGGVRVRPSTLAELDAMDGEWQASAGTPTRYCSVGSNLLAVTPQQDSTARLTYAYCPSALGSNDTPQLPPAYHPDLVEYGVYRVRLKEGAQQLARGMGNLNVFLDHMQALGDFVRARSRAARYDVQPFELALFDRSKLIEEIQKWQAKLTPKR